VSVRRYAFAPGLAFRISASVNDMNPSRPREQKNTTKSLHRIPPNTPPETYNQLNAYFATVPGNYTLNLRRMLLLNTNYADLSFLFTIHPGEKTNAHLGTEYLAVLETDNCTPYYLNLHEGEVAHTLILDMTGSGKTRLYALIKEKSFPSPIHLGPRAVAWVKSEIRQWAAERVQASRSVA